MDYFLNSFLLARAFLGCHVGAFGRHSGCHFQVHGRPRTPFGRSGGFLWRLGGALGVLGALLGSFWGAPGVPGRTFWCHFGVIFYDFGIKNRCCFRLRSGSVVLVV